MNKVEVLHPEFEEVPKSCEITKMKSTAAMNQSSNQIYEGDVYECPLRSGETRPFLFKTLHLLNR